MNWAGLAMGHLWLRSGLVGLLLLGNGPLARASGLGQSLPRSLSRPGTTAQVLQTEPAVVPQLFEGIVALPGAALPGAALPGAAPSGLDDQTLDAGELLFQAGDWVGAIAQWQQHLAQSPAPAERLALLHRLIESYLLLEHTAAAAALLQQAMALETEATPWLDRAETALYASQIFLAQGELEPAQAQLERCQALLEQGGRSPEPGRYRVLRGAALQLVAFQPLLQGESGPLEAALRSALAIYDWPVAEPTWEHRRQLYRATARVGLALGQLPQTPSGTAVVGSGQPLEAEIALAQSLNHRHAERDAWLIQGLVHQRRGDWPAALEAFNRALALARALEAAADSLAARPGGDRVQALGFAPPPPARATAHILMQRGWTQARLDQAPASAADFAAALAIFRQRGDLAQQRQPLNALMQHHQQAGQHRPYLEVAIAWHDLEQSLDPRSSQVAQAQQMVGFAHLNLGDPAAALPHFQLAAQGYAALDMPLQQAENLKLSGQLQQRLLLRSEAIASFQAALQLYQALDNLPEQITLHRDLGGLYRAQENSEVAIAQYRQALRLAEDSGDLSQTFAALTGLGGIYESLGDYPQSLATYQRAEALIGQLPGEETLSPGQRHLQQSSIAVLYNNLAGLWIATGDGELALAAYGKSLGISQALAEHLNVARTLNNIGYVQSERGEYALALDYHQQALTLVRRLQGPLEQRPRFKTPFPSLYATEALPPEIVSELRRSELQTLNNIAVIYQHQGDYRQALTRYEEALSLSQQLQNDRAQAILLSNLGQFHLETGNPQRGIEQLEQSLVLHRQLQDRAGEATVLGNLATAHSNLGQSVQALALYDQVLAIREAIGDRLGAATSRNNIATTHLEQGDSQPALLVLQQALAQARAVQSPSLEATILSNIASAYAQLSQYATAIEFADQSLALRRRLGDRQGEGDSLISLATLYDNLNQKVRAWELTEVALGIFRASGAQGSEATALNNLGILALDRGDLDLALTYYEQSLDFQRQVGDRLSEATALNNIGTLYATKKQHGQALDYLRQALTIAEETGVRPAQGVYLSNLGESYAALGEVAQAQVAFGRALPLLREVGDRAREARTLHNLGLLFKAQAQPELAVVFLKQSVQQTETIRQDLRSLSRSDQETYAESVASTYRALADLLLQQDRVLEAQQVLDLLKVQELASYLQDVRSSDRTSLVVLRPEAEILDRYNALQTSAIALGQELSQLRTIAAPVRTPAQTQRLGELVQLEAELNGQFNAFIEDDDVLDLLRQLKPAVLRQTLDLADLNRLRDDLAQQNAAILYPLILDDRLELILTTPGAPPLRRTVPVSRAQLNGKIVEFRRALGDPNSAVEPIAQELYRWLVEPLEADLAAASPDKLIYAPDGQLRYVPLAALWDGDRWLVERYRINNITAQSLTDFNAAPAEQLRPLAGAFAQGRFTVEGAGAGGSQRYSFSGLPFAGEEVKQLAQLLPETEVMVDGEFSRDRTLTQMNDFNILHLATHAAFVPGSPQDSFILFGNGETATLEDIQNWTLGNVDLVVLSACETGLGGDLGNGEEILGLGYQFQRAGARATVASLWQVDDGGTQALMVAFYQSLKQGKSKAEALQMAQQQLIAGDQGKQGGARGISFRAPEGAALGESQNQLAHPYYWAPFILIGNGL